MFRRALLILLTLTAAGSAVLAIATQHKVLIYWPNNATVPCWWKLYTAQADRGHFRIAFESYGKWQPLSQRELEQREAEARLWYFSVPLVDSPWTWRDWLRYHGFSAYCLDETTFSTAYEGGRAVEVKVKRRQIGCGLPAWFVCVVTGFYPTIAFIRGPMLRRRHRRKRGLCERCAYDLTSNTSGVCPECGTQIRVGEAASL